MSTSPERIYLDHNATTPVHPEVAAAMARIYAEVPGNGSSLHAEGRAARAELDGARSAVAGYFNAPTDELIFTGGGTEADNAALLGPVRALRAASGAPGHVVITAVEHPAVQRAAVQCEEEGTPVTRVLPGANGRVTVESMLAACRDDTVLVSCMAVNNETGIVQPVAELGTALRARGIWLHTDAVQACTKLPIDWATWPVDLCSISAHKFYGPKGTGALLKRRAVPFQPTSLGGGQEGGLRGGTENIAGIVGLAKALTLAAAGELHDPQRLHALTERLWEGIAAGVPEARRNGDVQLSAGNCVSICFAGIEADALNMRLDLAGIAVSAGSACASGAPEPSHVLLAMGLSKRDAKSSLRFSVGRTTTEVQVDRVVAVVTESVAALRALAR
ncbi:MAG: cysteine desulfurase family protein [Planctomycetota bacterium]|jgi:cysteine desulfurase